MATPIPDNRARFTAAEVARAVGGRAVELDPDRAVAGVTTDSRTAGAGGLFVALRGETHDGHRFAPAARERGALVLVAREAGLDGPRIEVDDTLAALGRLARRFVEREEAVAGRRPVLAVGGSAGKTTTKSLAAAAVRALLGHTLVTAGNLNNRIGVPMTLLTLAPGHRALVLECGTSVRGEIAALGEIARPDVSLVTNVGLEHSAGLGTLEEIADEEAALLHAARRAAVTNADEPLLVERLARTRANRLLFGTSRDATVRLAARSIDPDGRARLVFRVGERLSVSIAGDEAEVRIATPLLGPAAALNVAAALAGALALLGRPASPAELERAAEALGSVEAVPGRLAPRTIGGVFVLDDSYNSNPKSVAAALAAAREVADRRGARLVLALGDMLELGELSAAAHDEMLRAADALHGARLILIGAESTAAAGRTSPATPTAAFADSAAAAEAIGGEVRPGDVLLIKGSRGIRTERLAEALEAASET